MLRFQACPDRVFTAILHEALELGVALLSVHRTRLRPAELRQRDTVYASLYPRTAKFFARPDALDMMTALLAASQDAAVYQITDFHWLALYECLAVFCALHNDSVEPKRRKMRAVGLYRIGPIDFDFIVDHFFWDTDFLLGQDLLELSFDQRHGQLGVSDEAFSIAAGLRPHPDELRIVPRTEPDFGPGDMSGPKRGRIPAYPAEEDDDEVVLEDFSSGPP
jgi:hypothetical protein